MGSMTTKPPQPVIEAFFVDTNLNDPLLFSRAAALEREVVERFSAYFRPPGSVRSVTNLYGFVRPAELRKGVVGTRRHEDSR